MAGLFIVDGKTVPTIYLTSWTAQDNAPIDDSELDEDVKNDPVPVLPDDPPAEDDAETSPEPTEEPA